MTLSLITFGVVEWANFYCSILYVHLVGQWSHKFKEESQWYLRPRRLRISDIDQNRVWTNTFWIDCSSDVLPFYLFFFIVIGAEKYQSHMHKENISNKQVTSIDLFIARRRNGFEPYLIRARTEFWRRIFVQSMNIKEFRNNETD